MKVEKDYEEFFALFNKHNVRYVIIGAYAVGFHAKPRYTKDIDILVEPSQKNAESIMNALTEFGFGGLDLSCRDFIKRDNIIQLGYEPLRIDILTSVKGCGFSRAWKNRVVGDYGREKVYFIGIHELIKIKKLSGRASDKIDLALLLKIINKS